MPGYGYARAPKAQVAEWTRLVFDFLRGRANLRRVYVLVDARHGLKDSDIEALKLLDKAAVSYQVVLTKTDKVKPAELARVETETGAACRNTPQPIPRSSARRRPTARASPSCGPSSPGWRRSRVNRPETLPGSLAEGRDRRLRRRRSSG